MEPIRESRWERFVKFFDTTKGPLVSTIAFRIYGIWACLVSAIVLTIYVPEYLRNRAGDIQMMIIAYILPVLMWILGITVLFKAMQIHLLFTSKLGVLESRQIISFWILSQIVLLLSSVAICIFCSLLILLVTCIVLYCVFIWMIFVVRKRGGYNSINGICQNCNKSLSVCKCEEHALDSLIHIGGDEKNPLYPEEQTFTIADE